METRELKNLGWGAFAGLAGGAAEVLWVTIYAALSGNSAAEVAQGIAVAASGGLATSALAGIVIHMVLGAALGIALAAAWRRLPAHLGAASRFGLALVVLTAVWKINFFVVLPILSAPFVTLLPYGVTLASKMLFALAAAAVLRRGDMAGIRTR